MKKFLKLCLAVAALATMFGFASCSNGSSDDSGTTPASSSSTTKTTVTIGGVEYSTTDGTTNEDGSITITKEDGSSVTIKADGTIVYIDDEGNEYTGEVGGDTLTDESGNTVAVTSGTVDTNVFKGKVFVDEAQIFAFKSDGKVLWAQKNATFKELTYTVSSDTCTTDKFTGSINGTTFTAGDGNPKHTGSFTQITGDNEFGGKAFYTTTPIKAFIVFTTNNNVMIAMEGEREFETENYTISGSTATAAGGLSATLSGTTLTATSTAGTMTLTQIQ